MDKTTNSVGLISDIYLTKRVQPSNGSKNRKEQAGLKPENTYSTQKHSQEAGPDRLTLTQAKTVEPGLELNDGKSKQAIKGIEENTENHIDIEA